jgi:hypothetical protein
VARASESARHVFSPSTDHIFTAATSADGTMPNSTKASVIFLLRLMFIDRPPT